MNLRFALPFLTNLKWTTNLLLYTVRLISKNSLSTAIRKAAFQLARSASIPATLATSSVEKQQQLAAFRRTAVAGQTLHQVVSQFVEHRQQFKERQEHATAETCLHTAWIANVSMNVATSQEWSATTALSARRTSTARRTGPIRGRAAYVSSEKM